MAATGSEEAADLDGRRLAWRRLGSGQPLLLVNGYAASSADWDPGFLDALARRFELICPDNRGIGASEVGDLSAVSIDALAADLERLLDTIGIERVAVCGWSMGGFVAQRLVARAPRRVEALALLSTDPGGPDAVRAAPADWAALIDHSGTPREQASRLIALLFPPTEAAEIDRRFGDLVAEARAKLSPATLSAQERAMDEWHRREQERPHPAPPVLAAWGSEDIVIPAANAEPLGARWPGARSEVFAGGGHAFMAQEPTRAANLISSFLSR